MDPASPQRASCDVAYATITVCNQQQLADLYTERQALLQEKYELEWRRAQINDIIRQDIAVAKPYMEAMCNELQQALDLVNRGIAACPNGGNPITLPAFCQVPP